MLIKDNIIITQSYVSPCGTLLLGAIGEALCLSLWRCANNRATVEARVKKYFKAEFAEGNSDVLTQAISQLDEYFAGKRTAFSVPLRLAGTAFQQAAWHELQHIGYGHTQTYSQQAAAIGKPRAVRAVAAANRANALQIFIPCHRILGAGGALTGYAGGLEAKRQLLAFEADKLATSPTPPL